METFMDHYGNVAAERKLRTPGSKRVAESALAHGMLRLPGSKRDSVGAPSGGEDGGCAEAKEVKLPLPRSSGGEDGGGAEAKEVKLPLPRSSGE
ncbi:hypothetical protein PF008_g27481 [Phytophthora fragariae]|uniref:Uncharacterized protein n=1 Tax=Phytophthora fragariae TaxID=53985 RepID=A0A6G0QE16_9STRA|nr:hypothetical protein PF008_g27481 [Phytophthora fragariae]